MLSVQLNAENSIMKTKKKVHSIVICHTPRTLVYIQFGLCNYRGEFEEGMSSDVLFSAEAFGFSLC